MGLDEILQVEKRMSYNSCGSVSGSLGPVISRALMQFDLNGNGRAPSWSVIGPLMDWDRPVPTVRRLTISHTCRAQIKTKEVIDAGR